MEGEIALRPSRRESVRRVGAKHGVGASWWAGTSASTLVPLQVRMADDAAGWLDRAQLPGVMISRLSGPGGEFVRTADLIASHPRDAVLLSVALHGILHVSDGVRFATGTTAFCFADRPYVIGTESSSDVVTVKVPLRLLPLRSDGLRHASPLSRAHDQQAKVLRELSLSILSRDRHDSFEQRTWSDVTIGLVSLLLRGSGSGARTSGERARIVTFDAAVAVIERCHRDPTLTIEHIARQCRVSRRELEHAFAAHGSSPARHLRLARLRTSMTLLSDDSRAITISKIAHEVGFADVTTFARCFRREFQTTPHEWRTSRTGWEGVDPHIGLS